MSFTFSDRGETAMIVLGRGEAVEEEGRASGSGKGEG